jgi:hypothetical protein
MKIAINLLLGRGICFGRQLSSPRRGVAREVKVDAAQERAARLCSVIGPFILEDAAGTLPMSLQQYMIRLDLNAGR